MKKYTAALLLSAALVLSLWGCGKQNETSAEESLPSSADIPENTDGQESVYSDLSEPTDSESVLKENNPSSPSFSFADLKDLQFCFSSGAGGWATVMAIDEKGNFSGEYTDSDMGDTGDTYPNGTQYQCIFEGHFTDPEKINDYLYSTQADRIDYEKDAGSEEIVDGILYKYTAPHGLEDAGNILIYLPGAPLAELPGECKNWLQASALFDESGTELSFYALYNENGKCAFSGCNTEKSFGETLAGIENMANELDDSILNDLLTQAEYNEKTLELYELWDSALNALWDTLKRTLDPKTMETLAAEEREWVAQKEEAVEKAGEEFEGGSMQPMIRNQTAADMTKERVYELMALYLEP